MNVFMTMHTGLAALLRANAFVLGQDGIHVVPQAGFAAEQMLERKLREQVASQQYYDYFPPIARQRGCEGRKGKRVSARPSAESPAR